MKLSGRQREVLEQMAYGHMLFVRLQRSGTEFRQTCWISNSELHAMTVNALIAARLIEPRAEVTGTGGTRTTEYAMSYAGREAAPRAVRAVKARPR
ncbi:MAG: hypothetical protein ACREJG_02585 [Candidatus Rokuibacteriota bacterium]